MSRRISCSNCGVRTWDGSQFVHFGEETTEAALCKRCCERLFPGLLDQLEADCPICHPAKPAVEPST